MTERTCHHCCYAIGHPFGGLVCQLTTSITGSRRLSGLMRQLGAGR